MWMATGRRSRGQAPYVVQIIRRACATCREVVYHYGLTAVCYRSAIVQLSNGYMQYQRVVKLGKQFTIYSVAVWLKPSIDSHWLRVCVLVWAGLVCCTEDSQQGWSSRMVYPYSLTDEMSVTVVQWLVAWTVWSITISGWEYWFLKNDGPSKL